MIYSARLCLSQFQLYKYWCLTMFGDMWNTRMARLWSILVTSYRSWAAAFLKAQCIAVVNFTLLIELGWPSHLTVVRPPPDQAHLRRLGVFHFAHFIRGIPLALLPSEKVHKEGHKVFEGEIPTTEQYDVATSFSAQPLTLFKMGNDADQELWNRDVYQGQNSRFAILVQTSWHGFSREKSLTLSLLLVCK